MAALCREYEISRKTGYKFLNRYRSLGEKGLQDESRAPLCSPHRTPPEVVELLLRLKRKYPTWGAKKLRARLLTTHPGVRAPAQSTIHSYLQKAGLVQRQKHRRTTPRYSEKLTKGDAPNRVWCADFKGQFRLGNAQYCYPLTITDQYSRFLLRCEGLSSTKVKEAIPVWEAVFEEYGLPEVIRTDNGVPFATHGLAGLSKLSVYWLKQGIRPERIKPGSPQENGRHERMHRTLKAEATRPAGRTLLQQQDKFETFVDHYNNVRPHEAIGQRPPVELYTGSSRPYRKAREPAYPLHDDVRKLSKSGHLSLQGKTYFVGEALGGELLGLRELSDTHWLVSFCDLDLGCLDLKARRFSTHIPEVP